MADEHVQDKPPEPAPGEHVHGEHCSHSHGHAASPPPFTNSEVASMHDEDRKAAANIVVLMVAIFVSGVIGYMVVDYIVSTGW
jgi:hypothetical protein